MKIYDVHIHAEGTGAPQPSKLIENLEKAGVYGGNVISVRPEESYGRIKMNYEDRMKNVLAWTKGYEDRLFPVLWMHPREKDIIDKIKDASERGIRAFKMICDNYYVYEDMSMKVIEAVAKTKKPLMFHSGILWIGNAVAGEYNKPIHWEHLLNMPGLRFSMAHCSWPWYDECIALYGRMMAAYRTSPSGAPEMYFDLTPGTPEIYREDLFSKLFRIGYDVPHNTMFGADMSAEEYDSEYTKGWLALDNSLYDKLGIAE
ncbi:MAG: hypothetical protein IJO52_10890, partial [Clostridia bacterium]|nr:hypothetical protein [Clostridia bacterium]